MHTRAETLSWYPVPTWQSGGLNVDDSNSQSCTISITTSCPFKVNMFPKYIDLLFKYFILFR